MTVTLKVTHAEFQQQIIDLAHIYGWWHLHIRRSIGKGRKWVTTTNLKGWPDLLLMHPLVGYVAAELKIPPDGPTAEQLSVLDFLGKLPSTRAVIWTPDDWPDIERTLIIRRR